MSRLGRYVGKQVATLADGRLKRRLAGTIDQAYWGLHNLNDLNQNANGEAWLLERLRGAPVKRVLDLGANFGDWLAPAIEACPHAQLVACEAQPNLAQALVQRFERTGRVQVVAEAVGAEVGTLKLYLSEDGLANGFRWHGEARAIDVRMTTALALLEQLGWDTLDVLKIDIEGMELDVLKTLEPLLREQRIGIVQFEFGAFAQQRRQLLKDFYELFGAAYRVGRLAARRVEFAAYSSRFEQPEFCNYIACTERWAAWIEGDSRSQSST